MSCSEAFDRCHTRCWIIPSIPGSPLAGNDLGWPVVPLHTIAAHHPCMVRWRDEQKQLRSDIYGYTRDDNDFYS